MVLGGKGAAEEREMHGDVEGLDWLIEPHCIWSQVPLNPFSNTVKIQSTNERYLGSYR